MIMIKNMSKMKAIQSQLAKIHIAKKELRMDEADYRNAIRFYGVEHANQLTYDDAEELIEKFKQAGALTQKPIPYPSQREGSKNGWGKNKYTKLDNREPVYARSSKLRMIEALWREVSNSKTDESLQVFIKNRTGVDHITFLFADQARIIITALQHMKQNKNKIKNTN